MKRLILPFLCLLLLSLSTLNNGLTKKEREMALTELQVSHDHLMIALHGLNEEQLNYKMNPEAWSIAECVEHLAITENGFAGMLQGLLQTPADIGNREKVIVGDKELMTMLVDRSNKVKTSEPFEPSGKFGSHEATLEAFKKGRKDKMDMVKTSDADFRNRVQELPFGTIDGYQVFLLIAAHTDRHIRQIEEIKTSEGFPKM